jgi:cellulose synthase/poly-beta-1,6-N-acetylglucosamine synthase-like glycosyltransferase
MDLFEVLFWLCTATVAYTYVGFGMLVRALARVAPKPVARDDAHMPSVSLIIAACNEERVIREKLLNTLALRYPAGRLEILVVADGSSDRTADIVREFADNGIRLLHKPEREGKTPALNRGVAATRGDILLFSDANTFYGADTVRTLARNFADPRVGGVSGRKVVLDDDARAATEGETAYWGYEAALKMAESRCGSIVTADGEIFAMRRSLFAPLPRGIVHDDMYLTLRIVEDGYRVIYEPEATSSERASATLYDEFHLKVRYASAGFQILSRFRWLLWPPRTWFAVEFLSHKVLRWLAPFFLIGSLAGAAGAEGAFYEMAFLGQSVFYLLAALGWLFPPRARPAALYFPLYFSVMNGAACYGFFRYALVGQTMLWRKAGR